MENDMPIWVTKVYAYGGAVFIEQIEIDESGLQIEGADLIRVEIDQVESVIEEIAAAAKKAFKQKGKSK